MGLINLYTDLKSLKFGKDRIGGGSSNQPYIKTPIPEKIGEFGYLNQDFILRGGSKALTDSALDVVRLGKYFTDVRNPSGILFTIKQNLLSRMAVRTQASGKILNEGIYTPLSTLAEAGGVAFGLHVNKQGLNPFGGIGGINTYSDTIRLAKDESVFDSHDRLSVLYGYKILNDESTLSFINGIKVNSGEVNVLSYQGGPGSILGIGNTNIKFADQRTGLNNPNYGKNRKYQAKGYESSEEIKNNITTTPGIFDPISYSYDINSTLELKSFLSSKKGKGSNWHYSIESGSFTNKSVTFTTDQLAKISTPGPTGESQYIGGIDGDNPVTTPGDFRKNLRRGNKLQESQKEVGNLINAPEYNGVNAKNIEKRLFLGDPGNRTGKNLTSYTNGSKNGAASVEGNGSYDEINSSAVGSEFINDLVKFRIEVINNDKPSNTVNLQFRAFLNTISDSYNADWNSTKYIGRGENFYTYGGFDRKVSLSWTVAAQSKKELIPMYKKLNYLASIITPDYSSNGYMRGNLVKLSIGGYLFEQPGIITGFSYEMNEDNSTWEIGINDEGEYDSSVKELPHMIKVSGFNFIPIHNFVPKLVQSGTENFGTKEKYIALQATTNNYTR